MAQSIRGIPTIEGSFTAKSLRGLMKEKASDVGPRWRSSYRMSAVSWRASTMRLGKLMYLFWLICRPPQAPQQLALPWTPVAW